jgi:hypothetical protein
MSLNLELLDQEVSKEKLKLKATISGISHSGKTGTALMLAEKLAEGDWTKILAVDVGERNGISVYDYLGKFRTIKLPPPYTLNLITECIQYAVGKGYRVIIFDSLTQFWSGVGGALEQADKAGKNAWNKITPVLRKTMLDALDAEIHVIFTLRQKSDKVEEVNPETGKRTSRKIGMKDDFKPDSDYDFDLCIEMDRDHKAIAHKDRTRICPDNEFFEFTSDTASQIAEWTQKGKDVIGEMIAEAENLGIKEGNIVSKEAFIFANDNKSRLPKYMKLWYTEKDPTTGERKWIKTVK